MTFALSLLVAALAMQSPESKAIPKDSVEVEARGCIKGRMFSATTAPEDEGARRGPDVTGRQFRLAGKRDVMDAVKKYDGHRVAIVGIVRKSALADPGVGMKVGGARVVIGAQGGDPNNRVSSRMTSPPVAVMDVTAVRELAERCYVTP